MTRFKCIVTTAILLLCHYAFAFSNGHIIHFCGSETNDLYRLLKANDFKVFVYGSPAAAIQGAGAGTAVIIVSKTYPEVSKEQYISEALLKTAREKNLGLYIEYPVAFPGLRIDVKPLSTTLERGIVTSDVFGGPLQSMGLLGINDCHLLPVEAAGPLIVLGKVVGFNKAEYGLTDTKTWPLLIRKQNAFIAMTMLSNFQTARYGPDEAIRQVWTYILAALVRDKDLRIKKWFADVWPMYGKAVRLPSKARTASVQNGVEWFYKGRFFIHPQWKDQWLKYQTAQATYSPPVGQDQPVGDGTMGVIEGQKSRINYDGSQQYNYWVRADVHGEVSMALAAASQLLHNKQYAEQAGNLIDFALKTSNMRAGPKNDTTSPVYGLLGWSTTAPGVFYGDDNARAMLGIIAASGYLHTDKWDRQIIENLLANLRTTGTNGFRGERLEEPDVIRLGWKHYKERDIINPHPHFEAWLWACYLWLYQKTGYQPLLETAKKGIRITMDMFPDKWRWTNGIQQERARMILPLAWLVKIEDTPGHRLWLDQVVSALLEDQDACGAIREELGRAEKGLYGRTKKNSEYGTNEAPLIYENGDPVSDMLYTSNFALFSLNEAAHATGNKRYKNAVKKLADFLVRIQVSSQKHPDVDGAWFRAFDYNRWQYWASNADAGWGACSTLTGWIQSWIVATQVQIQQNQCFWDVTKDSKINEHMQEYVTRMLEK